MRNKVVRWFEPLGLLLLLAAFGWQCWEEHSNQTKVEGLVQQIAHKMAEESITVSVVNDVKTEGLIQS